MANYKESLSCVLKTIATKSPMYRSIINPSDIVHFDELVSAQEVKVLLQSSSDTDEETSDEGT